MWVGFAISASAMYLTLRNVSFGELAVEVSEARPAWFLPALAFFAASLAGRAYRWSRLMGRTPFWMTLHAQNIGYMLNSSLPFRLGEVARAYVIGAKTSTSMTRAFSGVVVERGFDLATVVALFTIFAQWVPMPPAFARAAAVGGAIVVALLACGGLLVWKADFAEKKLLAPVLNRVSPRIAARVLPKFEEITAGFRVIGSARQMLVMVLLTIWIWGTNFALTWCVLRSFYPGTLEQAGLVVVTANLGGALPSAPGGLGIVQGFASTALVVPFHVPEKKAIAFAFVWSIAQQIALMILGAFGLARVGMTFAEVRRGEVAETGAKLSPPPSR
jgi:glycosyltransferase 2 family protein